MHTTLPAALNILYICDCFAHLHICTLPQQSCDGHELKPELGGEKKKKHLAICSDPALLKDEHSHQILQCNNQSLFTGLDYSELVQSLI